MTVALTTTIALNRIVELVPDRPNIDPRYRPIDPAVVPLMRVERNDGDGLRFRVKLSREAGACRDTHGRRGVACGLPCATTPAVALSKSLAGPAAAHAAVSRAGVPAELWSDRCPSPMVHIPEGGDGEPVGDAPAPPSTADATSSQALRESIQRKIEHVKMGPRLHGFSIE